MQAELAVVQVEAVVVVGVEGDDDPQPVRVAGVDSVCVCLRRMLSSLTVPHLVTSTITIKIVLRPAMQHSPQSLSQHGYGPSPRCCLHFAVVWRDGP